MSRKGRQILTLSCSLILLSTILAFGPPSTSSRFGVVATDHELASKAGAEILSKGGNAVDAAISSVLAAGVVQIAGSGLGGGGFAVVQQGNEDSFVLDFRERAPSKATRDMYVGSNREKPSRLGGLAVAVPNEANGLIELHRRFGRLPLSKIALPSRKLSYDGFVIGEHLLGAFAKIGNQTTPDSIAQSLWGVDSPSAGQRITHARLEKTIRSWVKS